MGPARGDRPRHVVADDRPRAGRSVRRRAQGADGPPAVDATLTFEGVEPIVQPARSAPSSMRPVPVTASSPRSSAVATAIRSTRSHPARCSDPSRPSRPRRRSRSSARSSCSARGRPITSPATHNSNGINIRRPTDLIDGTVVQPGEEFDFVDVAGPITARQRLRRRRGDHRRQHARRGRPRRRPLLGVDDPLQRGAARRLRDRRAAQSRLLHRPLPGRARRDDLDQRLLRPDDGVRQRLRLSRSSFAASTPGSARSPTRSGAYRTAARSTFRRPRSRTSARPRTTTSSPTTLAPRQTERNEYAADGFTSSVTRTVRDRAATSSTRTRSARTTAASTASSWSAEWPATRPPGTRIPYSEGLPPAPNPTDPPGPDPTDPPNTADPVAKFGAAMLNNRRVAFSDNSTGGPTSWSWDFGDGSGSNERNPTHKYDAPGSYTVTLTVSQRQRRQQRSKTITSKVEADPTQRSAD